MSDHEALIEAIAERLSWDGGEMTRWSEDAHADHNRWSWRGGMWGEAMRDEYRKQARAAIDEMHRSVAGLGCGSGDVRGAVRAGECQGCSSTRGDS